MNMQTRHPCSFGAIDASRKVEKADGVDLSPNHHPAESYTDVQSIGYA